MNEVRRVLSVEVTYRGVSFAVLEGPERLIDRGSRLVSGDVSAYLAKLKVLLDHYRPDLVALEDPACSRKRTEVCARLAWTEQFVRDRGLEALALFRSRTEKYDQALAVTRLFPELSRKLPARPRLWESEPRAFATFVAVYRGLEAWAVVEARRSAHD